MPATIRRLLAPTILTVAALAATAPSALAAGSWSSPVPLTGAGNDGSTTGAFVTPDGRSLAVYSDASGQHLAVGGVAGAFSAPVTLSGTPSGSDAALGADGTLAVAWAAGGDAHVGIVAPGATTAAVSDLPGPGAAGASVAVADDGAVTVAYRTKSGASSYALVAATAPKGGAFSAPATLSSGSGAIDAPDVAAGSNGALAVAFRRQAPGYRAHVAVRPAGAAAFEPAQKLTDSGASDINTRVVFLRDGGLVAAWSNPTGAGWASRAAGAAAFGAPQPLGAAGTAGYDVDLVPTPQGGAAATWATARAVQASVLPADGAFGAATDITGLTSEVVASPRIAVAPDGTATVTVADPANGEVRTADLGGGARVIGYAPIGLPAPVAVAASADRTLAVWRDATGAMVAATRSAQAPPSTGLGTKPAAPDRTKPKVTVKNRTKAIKVTSKTTSVTFKVSCNEACAFSGGASLRTQLKGKKRKIAPLVSLRAGKPRKGTQNVTFKFTTSARKDLKAALKQGRGGQVYVDLTAADAASNTTRTTWHTSLRKR